jgi:hypothetical protein
MTSNSPKKTIMTINGMVLGRLASAAGAGDAAPLSTRSAKRWTTPKGPQLGNKCDGLPILGQRPSTGRNGLSTRSVKPR